MNATQMTTAAERRAAANAKYAAQAMKENAQAVRLYPAIERWVKDIDGVPIMTRDRSCGRKETAKLARELFAMLGLKGISVTAPNYSMAQTVDVRLPQLSRHDAHCETRTYDDAPCRTCVAKHNAEKNVAMILSAAFPNHDDRSDSQSDYFDYKWSIN